jgi:hypothetical protein
MKFISDAWLSETGIRRNKAPAGYMYEIYGIQIANTSTVGINFVATTKYVEEEIALIPRTSEIFFAFDCNIDGGNMVLMLPKPIRTKFFTWGPESASAINVTAILYYELAKASIPDLVWAFISRGKNP